MTADPGRKLFLKGLREALPFTLVIGPFGLLFGVVATEAGLDLFEIMSMTFLVLAGASQFAAVQLMADHASVLVVIVTALAVNLRMAMYSASLTPHLGHASLRDRALVAYLMVDQCYALAIQDYEANPGRSLGQKLAYFFGASACVVPVWYGMVLIGALFGTQIPEGMALDFAVPVTFLAMIAPMLRTLAHLAAALVSILLGLAFAWVPHGGGLFIAAFVAMVTGAQVELWTARWRAVRGLS